MQGPMISSANKVERLDFTRVCLDTEDDFNNIIWTDKSSIQLKRHSETMGVKIDRRRNYKHGKTCHGSCLGGISMYGATKICMFDKIMDAALCVNIWRAFSYNFWRRLLKMKLITVTALCKTMILTYVPADLPKAGMQKIASIGGQHQQAVLA